MAKGSKCNVMENSWKAGVSAVYLEQKSLAEMSSECIEIQIFTVSQKKGGGIISEVFELQRSVKF